MKIIINFLLSNLKANKLENVAKKLRRYRVSAGGFFYFIKNNDKPLMEKRFLRALIITHDLEASTFVNRFELAISAFHILN